MKIFEFYAGCPFWSVIWRDTNVNWVKVAQFPDKKKTALKIEKCQVGTHYGDIRKKNQIFEIVIVKFCNIG